MDDQNKNKDEKGNDEILRDTITNMPPGEEQTLPFGDTPPMNPQNEAPFMVSLCVLCIACLIGLLVYFIPLRLTHAYPTLL